MANISFKTIHENTMLMKISEFTVLYLPCLLEHLMKLPDHSMEHSMDLDLSGK